MYIYKLQCNFYRYGPGYPIPPKSMFIDNKQKPKKQNPESENPKSGKLLDIPEIP
jgi:hypothetical protein